MQAVAGAVLRPRTEELHWTTTSGHLLSAKLRAVREDAGGGEGDLRGPIARLAIDSPRLLLVGNESGLEESSWKVGLDANLP